MRFGFRGLAIFALSLAIVATIGRTVAAQDATVLPPDAEVDGLSLGEWSARWWQWLMSIPTEFNPVVDETGARCGWGQSGPVFFLVGSPASVERTCTIPVGVAIFVPLGNSECSTLDAPPYFGRDETELKACAVVDGDQSGAAGLSVTIDGQAVANLEPYRTTTPPFLLNFPEGNLYGLPAGVGLSVADGYQLIIAPPTPGEHEVRIAGPGPEGEIVVVYHLTIAEPMVIEPAASPVADA